MIIRHKKLKDAEIIAAIYKNLARHSSFTYLLAQIPDLASILELLDQPRPSASEMDPDVFNKIFADLEDAVDEFLD